MSSYHIYADIIKPEEEKKLLEQLAALRKEKENVRWGRDVLYFGHIVHTRAHPDFGRTYHRKGGVIPVRGAAHRPLPQFAQDLDALLRKRLAKHSKGDLCPPLKDRASALNVRTFRRADGLNLEPAGPRHCQAMLIVNLGESAQYRIKCDSEDELVTVPPRSCLVVTDGSVVVGVPRGTSAAGWDKDFVDERYVDGKKPQDYKRWALTYRWV